MGLPNLEKSSLKALRRFPEPSQGFPNLYHCPAKCKDTTHWPGGGPTMASRPLTITSRQKLSLATRKLSMDPPSWRTAPSRSKPWLAGLSVWQERLMLSSASPHRRVLSTRGLCTESAASAGGAIPFNRFTRSSIKAASATRLGWGLSPPSQRAAGLSSDASRTSPSRSAAANPSSRMGLMASA